MACKRSAVRSRLAPPPGFWAASPLQQGAPVVFYHPQADAWTVYVQSKLVELESAKAVSDRKWGENRLITLF